MRSGTCRAGVLRPIRSVAGGARALRRPRVTGDVILLSLARLLRGRGGGGGGLADLQEKTDTASCSEE